MQQIDEFKLKDGRIVQIVLPSMNGLRPITDFVNRLTDEDTYLTFIGEHISLNTEKKWLENTLKEIEYKKNYVIWVKFGEQIVGVANILHGKTARDFHIGTIGLMVDRDFRRGGLGTYLLEQVLKQGQKMNLKIAQLDVFSDNNPGRNLYHKMGFKECGHLPNGLFRQNKYSDKIEMYKNLEEGF